MVRTSNGFLIKSKKVLWKELCEEWDKKSSQPKPGAASGLDAPPQEPFQTADSLPGNDGEGNSVSSVHTSQIEHSEGAEGQAPLGCDGEERLHWLSGSSLRRNGVTLPPHRSKSINDEGRESGK